MEKLKNILLNLLGIIFIIFGITAIFNSLLIENPFQIIWMCYIALILIGFGMIYKSSFLIASQLNIIAIPSLVWDIVFFYQLITKKPLFGITSYFFAEQGITLSKIVSIQHLFTIPLSLIAIYFIKLKYGDRDSWRLSMLQAIVVYVLVLLLTIPEKNINCVFKPCININLGFPYVFTWFLIILIQTFVTNFLINKLFIKKKKSINNS